MMNFQNPDPEANDILQDGFAGTRKLLNGTMRPRYDILKELGAPLHIQKEMRELTSCLFFMGIAVGVGLSFIAVLIMGLLHII